jgi:hypothetical protein
VEAVSVEVLKAGSPFKVIVHNDLKLTRMQAAIRLYAAISTYPQNPESGISVWA